MKNHFRIFVGVVEIAGYYGNLAFGLREQGHLVTVAGASGHVFDYSSSSNQDSSLIKIYDALLKIASLNNVSKKKTFSHLLKRKLLDILVSLVKIVMFFWALPKHDVFIFGFGSSFFPENFDLPLLRFFDKKIICNVAHGSEARPPYINGGILNGLSQPITTRELAFIRKSTKIIKRRCFKVEKYADVVIGAPLTSHFLKKPFINIFYLGLGFKDPTTTNPVTTKVGNIGQCRTKKTQILHCPSNPMVKGTSSIRNAITSLKSRGYAIDYIELTGKPHHVVLEALHRCDFVVDQAYSDFPMPGFVTEAAWFAKPSVVGGYGWQPLEQIIPDRIFPPSHLCHPDALESAIEKLITDQPYRLTLGKKAQNFVKSNWSIQHFADRYLQLINANIPKDWWANPCQINYLQGCGVSETTLLRVLPQILRDKKNILQLQDKPSLEKDFFDFVQNKAPKNQ